MSARELVVLGTSSQVPTRYRNHNGYLLLLDGTGYLFDPGEGTQRQMTCAGVAASQLHHILITHFHGDHCLGLPGIVQRISLDRVSHPVHVHFPASGAAYFERLRHASIFADHSQIVPAPIHKAGVLHTDGQWTLSTLPLVHSAPSWGYRLVEADSQTLQPARLAELGLQGPNISQLIRDGSLVHDGRTLTLGEVSVPRAGQSAAVVMDTQLCDAAFELAQDVDMLVCESTFLNADAKLAREYGHLTAAQAGRIAQEGNVGTLVLTHFSQRYPNVDRFLEEAQEFHPNVVAARDLIRVPMPSRKRQIE